MQRAREFLDHYAATIGVACARFGTIAASAVRISGPTPGCRVCHSQKYLLCFNGGIGATTTGKLIEIGGFSRFLGNASLRLPFHDRVPADFVGRVWAVMEATPHHTYQILTKRPERMAAVTKAMPVLENVWLGVSVESPDYLHRIDYLREVHSSVRFISFEPLLASVANANLSGIHWAIVGGESGPNSRPMREEWVDEIEVACRQHGTAFFFKQWGGVRKKANGRHYRDRLFDEMPIPSLRA